MAYNREFRVKSFKEYIAEGKDEVLVSTLRELGVIARIKHNKLYVPKEKIKKVKSLLKMMMSTASNFRPPMIVGE